jgi:hypothetical protein
MSDKNTLDDEFMGLADDLNDQSRGGSGDFTPPEYETPEWTGLEVGSTKVVRFLGTHPQAKNLSVTDPRIVNFAWIKGDNGKNFRSVLPAKEAEPDHLMWRIISAVNKVEYINRKRVFVNEAQHPDIFNIVNKNGLKPDDKKFKFEKGWPGKNVMIANVIDREMMDWHREHKHSRLLSRNVYVSPDGKVYPEDGVPVYGIYEAIVADIFKHYGSWEKYDIGIIRTGQMQPAYKVFNATAFSKVPNLPDLVGKSHLVVDGPLTAEEAGWERYDIGKIYKHTTYTKYYNRLKQTIKGIDAALRTNFLEELKELADTEKAQWEAEKKARGREQQRRHGCPSF